MRKPVGIPISGCKISKKIRVCQEFARFHTIKNVIFRKQTSFTLFYNKEWDGYAENRY